MNGQIVGVNLSLYLLTDFFWSTLLFAFRGQDTYWQSQASQANPSSWVAVPSVVILGFKAVVVLSRTLVWWEHGAGNVISEWRGRPTLACWGSPGESSSEANPKWCKGASGVQWPWQKLRGRFWSYRYAVSLVRLCPVHIVGGICNAVFENVGFGPLMLGTIPSAYQRWGPSGCCLSSIKGKENHLLHWVILEINWVNI
jgi:hypothetical protein